MKVLQINKLYYPWIGGVEKVVQQISEGLSDEVEIEVLACQSRGFGQEEDINGVPIKKTSSLGIFKGMPVSPSYPLRFFQDSAKADIIHFHLPFPLGVLSEVLNPRGNYKIVITYHSDIVRQKLLLKAYKPLLRRFLDRADRILPTSPNLLRGSNLLRERKDRCEVIPLSLDLDEFRDGESRPLEVDIPENMPVILFVGRLSYYKGVSYLLEAMKQVDATLLVAGDGDMRKELSGLAEELCLEDKVVFLGYVEDEELAYCYRNSDIFVLPSIEPSEAFGIVQLEAMASGLPIVNTDLPTGVPYVSQDGETGFTVPPRDPEALAKAINRLLEDEETRERFARNAVQRVEDKFTQERMLDSIYSVYRELAS